MFKRIQKWLSNKPYTKAMYINAVATILIAFIAVASLCASIHSCSVSRNNSETVRSLAKLDLQPAIQIRTLFKSIGKIPPHYSVTNAGPVDAVQVEVKLWAHRFSSEQKKFYISLNDSSENLGRIKPQETKSVKFQNGWLMTNARIEKPVQANVMEIRISYRRPQDLREYTKSAFYFVDPNESWVPERSSSLDSELYKTMMAALFDYVEQKQTILYFEVDGDRLH